MSEHVLVTGGCGFIGSHIVEALVSEGHRVRVLDNLSSGHRKNLDAVKGEVEIIEGDVRDTTTVVAAMQDVSVVFHEAALVSVFDSVERPRDNHDINSTGTLNVLIAARDHKVRRLVFASTAAIYGNDPTLPKREEMRPQPESPYGVAKLSGEHYLRIFYNLYGLETVALRYFNVYGPRQDPRSPYSGVVSKFVQCAREKSTPTVFGDGQQTRDFVFVRDIVQANLKAMKTPGVGDGSVFNVASGRTASLLDLLRVLSELTGQNMEPTFAPVRSGDIRDSAASIAAIEERMGYRAAHDLKAGLRELLVHEGVSVI
ncbi:MAG: SDR family oxidoreductase [Kiritimatiellae bacterium]|nr:SDR family oxidoreductase [Kiritimatiellia bacterium]